MNCISDLNEFLLPFGYYVTIIDKGVYMIHDSINNEALRRVFHLEDVLWYMVDHHKDNKR